MLVVNDATGEDAPPWICDQVMAEARERFMAEAEA